MACRKCDSRRLTERFSHDASHDQIHFPPFKSYEYRDSRILKAVKPFFGSSEQCAGSSEAAVSRLQLFSCINTKRSFFRFSSNHLKIDLHASSQLTSRFMMMYLAPSKPHPAFDSPGAISLSSALLRHHEVANSLSLNQDLQR
jgi:hypothetical protein